MIRVGPYLRWLQNAIWEPSIGLLLVVGLGIRLILIPWFTEPFNAWAGYLSTNILVRGLDPFSLFATEPRFQQLGPWPYPAEFFLFSLSAFVGADGASALYSVLIRLPNAAADAGTGLLLFRIARRFGSSEAQARTCAAAYLLSPFTIIVSAVWGTNDPIAVFLTVLSMHFLLRRTDRDVVAGSFVLGVGIATKLYPVLLLPIALALAPTYLRKAKVLGLASAVPVVTAIPFILSNARAYGATVFGFAGGTSGLNRGQLDPQFTILRFISWFVGPLDSRLAFVSAGGLCIALYVVYRLVRDKRLDESSAAALVVLLAYLLAVRWSPNYLLWPVPFVTLFAIRSQTGWHRWLTLGFWAPSLAYTLVFNGWYPDPYSGGSGFTYWAIVSGLPGIRPFEAFPSGLAPGLILATVATVAIVVRSLVHRPVVRTVRPEPPAANNGKRGQGPRLRVDQTRFLGSVLSIIFVFLFVISIVFQASHARPVAPSDFASFDVLPDGTISMKDDFHAEILSFRWTFSGTGRYSLHPNGTSGIEFDTGGPSGTASIENLVVADRVSIQVTFRINALYGAEPLEILRANSSVLQVVPAGATWTLQYVDRANNQSTDLGIIGVGWTAADIVLSGNGQQVEALGNQVSFPPSGPVTGVQIGPGEPYPDAGGSLVISQIEMQWASVAIRLLPLSPVFVLVTDLIVLVPPLILYQICKDGGGRRSGGGRFGRP